MIDGSNLDRFPGFDPKKLLPKKPGQPAINYHRAPDKFLPDLKKLDGMLPGISPLDLFQRTGKLTPQGDLIKVGMTEAGPEMNFMRVRVGSLDSNVNVFEEDDNFTKPMRTVRRLHVLPVEGTQVLFHTLGVSRSEGIVSGETHPPQERADLREIECDLRDGSKMRLEKPALSPLPRGIWMRRPDYNDPQTRLYRWFPVGDNQSLINCATMVALWWRGGLELETRKEVREAILEAQEGAGWRDSVDVAAKTLIGNLRAFTSDNLVRRDFRQIV